MAVDVGAPGAVRGPTLLAADPAAIHAISLVKPGVFSVIKHTAGELALNTSLEQSPYFRTVAANSDCGEGFWDRFSREILC